MTETQSTLAEAIEQRIVSEKLFTRDDHLLCAVSGGPDSVCLLHVLLELGYRNLSVLHLNHQLRGADADHDTKMVTELAQKWGLPIEIARRDTRAYASAQRLSLEDAARQLRHQFFSEIAAREATLAPPSARVVVVLAHHTKDQAETVLMRFLRGAGPQGLSGMSSLSRIGALTLVRPMLGVSRDAIMAFIEANEIRYCTDFTNDQPIHLRNRIRHELLPLLKNYNPNIESTLCRMADLFEGEELWLDEIVQSSSFAAVKSKTSKGIRLSASILYSYPIALQRRVVRKIIEEVMGSTDNVSWRYIDNFLARGLTTIRQDSRGVLHTSKELL